MLAAFWSEWAKLRRRNMLLWGFGGGLAFTIFATVLTIEQAKSALPVGKHAGGKLGFRVTDAELAQPDGLVHGVVHVSNFIGIVALCLFAGAVASEYSQGTLRNLLVRQPRRLQLLSGKFLALALFFAIAVTIAMAASSAIAFALAPAKGISTSAWTSSTGVNDLGQALLHVFLASVGYGVLGTALAVVLRSPASAIALGVAYVLPVEAIVNQLWEGGERWLPGQLLSALAHGGTTGVSYSDALETITVYAVVAAIATLALFKRRDAN
jgi:ABC-type transport system involved in multi-copper enzyme maturation permease subunit